ncbi:hypothetical protein GC197_12445 [bacterium]|nr:hypothetical protein [bacterium]
MAKAKRKTLPKDFDALLEKRDLADLKAVFDVCHVDARGGYRKQTALAYDKCPDDLARWLVAQGADLSAVDKWDRTPLHNRAASRRGDIGVLLELGGDVSATDYLMETPLHAAAGFHNANNARLLLEHGAEVNQKNQQGQTPLELALFRCQNVDINNMVPLAKVLLEAGAERTPQISELVEKIGKQFEFHRSSFNPESVDEVSDALKELYQVFEVEPVAPHQTHDGVSTIVVKATTWQSQHDELWNLLVPSQGHAATVQGEVIRITGRIAHELEGNGGVNWDADYKKMADAFLEHVRSGQPLSPTEFAEAADVVVEVKRESGDTARMAQLAVKWVLQNLDPVKLNPPPYKR